MPLRIVPPQLEMESETEGPVNLRPALSGSPHQPPRESKVGKDASQSPYAYPSASLYLTVPAPSALPFEPRESRRRDPIVGRQEPDESA